MFQFLVRTSFSVTVNCFRLSIVSVTVYVMGLAISITVSVTVYVIGLAITAIVNMV